MKILVIGGGGREHALGWALHRSSLKRQLYFAPGNGGTHLLGRNLPISAEDIAGLVKFARQEKIDLTVVGPEAPLAAGVVDTFHREGLRIFGPTRAAARLESSKVFAKRLMWDYSIPTACFKVCDSPAAALEAVRRWGRYPVVLKADGLAAGKGVIIADSLTAAEQAIRRLMVEKAFGAAGERVVVEEFLSGPELSAFCLTDGQEVVLLEFAKDYKRLREGDTGPNTGGMGAISPHPLITDAVKREIRERVFQPVLQAMRDLGTPYQGVLYAGLIATAEGLHVLEFNVRFGDPETQVLLPRLQTDFLVLLAAAVEGRLGEIRVEWSPDHAAGVVLASAGYPGKYEKGKPITGLEEVTHSLIFHAGTRREGDQVLTNGGRVLNVVALAPTLKEALGRAYADVEAINFEGKVFRADIGA